MAAMQGAFATPQFLRRERRWQRAGLGILSALVASTMVTGTVATVWRAASVYVFLLVVFRLAGHRTLAQITNFDLILVLIIGDATQQAIIGDDYTVTTAAVAVSTLVLLDLLLARLKDASPGVDAVVDGLPAILFAHGHVEPARMSSEGVGIDDILTAAREQHGLTRLDQIEFAVLEKTGGISIVPRR